MNDFQPINAAGIKPAVYQSTGIRMQCSGIDLTTKACLCKVDANGVCSPTEVPHTASALTADVTPIYVYEEGSYEASANGQTFASFSVLGAAGIVKVTLSAGQEIAPGDLLQLDADGYVMKSPSTVSTSEIRVGIALEAVTTTDDPSTIQMASYCPVEFVGQVGA